MSEPIDLTEAEVDAVIAEFGGDLRAAIGALLHDLTLLALDRELSVSRGYVRGRSLGAAVAALNQDAEAETAKQKEGER